MLLGEEQWPLALLRAVQGRRGEGCDLHGFRYSEMLPGQEQRDAKETTPTGLSVTTGASLHLFYSKTYLLSFCLNI